MRKEDAGARAHVRKEHAKMGVFLGNALALEVSGKNERVRRSCESRNPAAADALSRRAPEVGRRLACGVEASSGRK